MGRTYCIGLNRVVDKLNCEIEWMGASVLCMKTMGYGSGYTHYRRNSSSLDICAVVQDTGMRKLSEETKIAPLALYSRYIIIVDSIKIPTW